MVSDSKSDEEQIKEFIESDKDYLPVDKDRLILYVIHYLESRKIEATFDKITITAFKLFPKKFSLVGFPEYPDAKTVNDCVFLHCVKTKNWVSGNAQTGYKITERGGYFLDEANKMLEGKIKITKKYGTVPRRKEFTFISLLKGTIAFKKYFQGKKDEIKNSEILEALRLPSSGSKEIAEKHLKKYREYANRIDDSSAVEFLEYIRKRV